MYYEYFQHIKIASFSFSLLQGKDLKTVIKISIRLGYRLIDTAFYYKNEKEIGEAIKDKIADGTVKREDLFVVEKVIYF